MPEAVIFNLQHPDLMAEETNGTSAANAVLFESVFKTHFKDLHSYACTIVKDEAAAEEIVQQVFFKLWERKEEIKVQQSVTAYLYRAVHNESLNYLKHANVKARHHAGIAYHSEEHRHSPDNAALKELQQKISEALQELPEQCRTVFQLSRFEELSYRAIAEKLGISVKTVENQMGKALKILRTKLLDYLPALLLLFINVKNILQ